jgi:hypothetical protein
MNNEQDEQCEEMTEQDKNCNEGDYNLTIIDYVRAIQLDPSNAAYKDNLQAAVDAAHDFVIEFIGNGTLAQFYQFIEDSGIHMIMDDELTYYQKTMERQAEAAIHKDVKESGHPLKHGDIFLATTMESKNVKYFIFLYDNSKEDGRWWFHIGLQTYTPHRDKQCF